MELLWHRLGIHFVDSIFPFYRLNITRHFFNLMICFSHFYVVMTNNLVCHKPLGISRQIFFLYPLMLDKSLPVLRPRDTSLPVTVWELNHSWSYEIPYTSKRKETFFVFTSSCIYPAHLTGNLDILCWIKKSLGILPLEWPWNYLQSR